MQPRVLIIEDNATNTDLMAYLIHAAGWTTLTAIDGADGLLQIERERPDLVLCDIHIPKPDGFEVVARLKANPELVHIPIIAVTALAMMGDRERAYAAGFDGYLPKPIVPETFMESLRQFIPGSALTASSVMADAAASSEPAEESARAESILIVDDRPENIDLCRSILSPMLREIYVASDVASALRLVAEKRPDLVLTDIRMPNQSGLDLLEAVRREPTWSRTAFAVISSLSYDDFHTLLRTRQSRPDAILFRPLEPTELVTAIEGLLKQIDDRRPQA
jgi:two-component system, cell cycle response regulator